jgi:DNA helicase-2/ATP-dependent DNA helicase PcrA
VLIVAGAGTGKTTTLAHRVAWLIAQGAAPSRVLLLTFTRRAAAEMMARATALVGRSASNGTPQAKVWGGTFHAAGARLLRLHSREFGMEPDFTILDRGDAEDLMHLCRTDLCLGQGAKRFPQKSTCLDIYSRCINAQTPLTEVLAQTFPWCKHAEKNLARLFAAYTDAKENQRVLDYDDLLLFWRGLLMDPAAGDSVRGRFDHVLVDEYQDTNALQADIVALLRPDSTGITAVGDDAQAIYGFRAATVRNILEFASRHPEADVLTLTRNYRSTAPILDATNALIAEAPERHVKDLWTTQTGGGRPSLVSCRDEAEQTTWIADRVLEHREQGAALKDQAVLFRAQHHSLDLEVELARRQIPYRKYGGLKFAETAHVKDLVSFLRLAENPRDSMAALRVLGLLPGIGPKTALALSGLLAQGNGNLDTWSAATVPEPTRPIWPAFVSLMRWLAAATGEVPAQVHAVRTFYAPLLQARFDNSAGRLADLEQIESISSRCENRAALLADLVLDPPSWTGELSGPPLLDEDWLVLSTMHSAKGLEFDTVYVIHAADGNIPSDMATGSVDEIEEERRLFYVACTRAKRHLYVTHPLRYYKAGNPMTDSHGYAQRTRFMSASVLPHFIEVPAVVLAEGLTANETALPGPATSSAAIRDGVRKLWG